jgi:hypothetical protein
MVGSLVSVWFLSFSRSSRIYSLLVLSNVSKALEEVPGRYMTKPFGLKHEKIEDVKGKICSFGFLLFFNNYVTACLFG